MSKLSFAFGNKQWQFHLQDKADRIERLGEKFNKLTVTPAVPNGEVIQLSLNTFIYQIQRQYLYGLVDEFFKQTFNPLVFPFHWQAQRVIGAWGYISGKLIQSGPSSQINGLEVAPDVFEDFSITNPYTRVEETQAKIYRVTSDFVKLVKVTNTLYQAWNDNSKDEETGLPNASMKLFCRQKLAEGAVVEVYPTVVPRTREDGSLWLGNRLQLTVQKLHEWMSEIDAGKLDLDTAASQFYAEKALRTRHYQNFEKNVATGVVTDELIEQVAAASRQFAMGETVEESGLKVKLEGVIVDVNQVPADLYSAIIDGRKEWFDTKLRVGRIDLSLAAQKYNSALDLTPDQYGS